jgi:fluoroacetyl-CoA thioesterase
MVESLTPGAQGECEVLVCEHNVAPHVPVFSTPSLVMLCERAAINAVAPHLPADQTTVGYEVHVRHIAATPIGKMVRARAELVEVNGNKLTFRVEAHDDEKKVGEGLHKRAVVRKSFGDKAS